MSDIGRRIGKFSIKSACILDKPKLALSMMRDCIVVRAERMWHDDTIEYTALSESFAPVKAGELAPEYMAIFTVDENGVELFRGWVSGNG